ncbi:Aste57867_2389 [Aphanomyces stellatus]|uniref:Aste57867_2389 protein n=1 Tax=Aphanomyces stellatus TaxID=120398 RepID=A0A485K862_9STRA|nr:hypothetical protein As57867_002383 [Aphanomyces stellatus]VFT79590.1 Aste57867_2389 [Aphanomyces stellatus]
MTLDTPANAVAAPTAAPDAGQPNLLRKAGDTTRFEKYRAKLVLSILGIPTYDRTDSDIRIVYQFLKDRDLFTFLSPHALLYVAAECTVSKAQDGDVLHYQDEDVTGDSQMHIILDGSLCGYKNDKFAQRKNHTETFAQWLSNQVAESNEPLDFGDCITTFQSGKTNLSGLSHDCFSFSRSRVWTQRRGNKARDPQKIQRGMLAQESTTAISIRKDTLDRASAYMGSKSNSVFVRQDSVDDINRGNKTALHAFLQQFAFMTQLSEANQKAILETAHEKKLRKNEPLLTPATSSYDIIVVLTGCLAAYRLERNTIADAGVKAVTKNHGVELAQIQAGESYGEYNVWNNQPLDTRDDAQPSISSLVAIDTTEVVLIDRRQYAAILVNQEPRESLISLLAVPRLERHYFFRQLPDRVLTRVAETSTGMACPSDKVVYNKVSDADNVYFVLSGRVVVHINAADAAAAVVAQPGDTFGLDEVRLRRKRQRIAMTKAPSFLLKFPATVYFECLHELTHDLCFMPGSGFLALQQTDGTPLGVAHSSEIAKFLRCIRAFAHVPLYVLVELLPYMRVQHLTAGDVFCTEDSTSEVFVGVVTGRLSCHSRERADDTMQLFQHRAFVHVPSLHGERIVPHESIMAFEKKLTVVYGSLVHLLQPGDVCRTSYFDDGTATHRTPATMVAANSPTTLLSISQYDANQVLQRLVDWSKPATDMKTVVGSVGTVGTNGITLSPDETRLVLKQLRFPIDKPDKVVGDFTCVTLQPGDIVVSTGEVVKHFVIVLTGQLSVSVLQTKLSAAPIATTANPNMFMKLLTSNFKSTSKTLASLGTRDARRLSTLLPTIANMSRTTPWWHKQTASVAPQGAGRRLSVLRVQLDKPKDDHVADEDGAASAPTSSTGATQLPRLKLLLVTLGPGDVWGGDVTCARSWTSLHDVVAETVTEVLLCSRDRFTALRQEAMAAVMRKPEAHSKRLLAKAHWKRANIKVVETLQSNTNGPKPKFWRLLDQAANQRIKLIIKHLSHMELFQSMADETIANIVASARYDTVEKGAIIYTAGDAPKRYHVVVAGKIGLYSPHLQLEDHCLNVIHSGGGFGEFEIIMEQLTRSLSAIAEDTTKLISFASQPFLELWDKSKIDAIRAEIAFFQELHWTQRLEMDKLAHIYHTAQAVAYHKGADVVKVHAHLNHCFIIKDGSCYLGNVLNIQAKNGTSEQIETMHVASKLAQVSKGHSIWVLGEATFSLTAATANTIVYNLNFEFLRAIMPKHHVGRLEKQIKQHDEYHTAQSNMLRARAMHILNTRTHVATSVGEPEMFLPDFDLSKHDVSMTDVVAATPMTLAQVQAARALFQPPASDNHHDDDDHVTDQSSTTAVKRLLGSFWNRKRGSYRRSLMATASQPSHGVAVSTAAVVPSSPGIVFATKADGLRPSAMTTFATEVPEESFADVARDQYFAERYDVRAPFRTLRLSSISKSDAAAMAKAAALNEERFDEPLVVKYFLDMTPNTTESHDTSFLMNDAAAVKGPVVAAPQVKAAEATPSSIDQRPHAHFLKPSLSTLNLLPLTVLQRRKTIQKPLTAKSPAAHKNKPPPTTVANDVVAKTGKLGIRQASNQKQGQSTVYMVAVLRGSHLRMYRHEHDVHRKDMVRHEWTLSPMVEIVEWPPDARTPCDFQLYFPDVAGVWFTAVSLEEKSKWVAKFKQGMAADDVGGAGPGGGASFVLNPSRIVPIQKEPVASARRPQTVTEEFLPEVSYVVAFEQ